MSSWRQVDGSMVSHSSNGWTVGPNGRMDEWIVEWMGIVDQSVDGPINGWLSG